MELPTDEKTSDCSFIACFLHIDAGISIGFIIRPTSRKTLFICFRSIPIFYPNSFLSIYFLMSKSCALCTHEVK